MMFTIHIGKVIKELWVLTACKSTGIRRIAGLASIAAGQSVTSEKSKKKKGNEKWKELNKTKWVLPQCLDLF